MAGQACFAILHQRLTSMPQCHMLLVWFLCDSCSDAPCVCFQPCNPAVGGPAKSQLVHEVDAMGGEMGKMADRCYLQKRVLNASKVPLPTEKQRTYYACLRSDLGVRSSCDVLHAFLIYLGWAGHRYMHHVTHASYCRVLLCTHSEPKLTRWSTPKKCGASLRRHPTCSCEKAWQ